jgi:hypothetical protein
MPSRRLQRLHLPRPDATGWAGFHAIGRWFRGLPLLLAAAAMLAACGSAGTAPVTTPVRHQPNPLDIPSAERPYLLDVLTGFPQEVPLERHEAIEDAWRVLFQESDIESARQTAARLLEEDPGFAPAQVLAAQVDFIEGHYEPAVRRLQPLGEALPGYTASQLLLGRAAEKLGDVPLAYAAFRSLATRNSLAFQRTGELHPRALEILYNRLNEDLKRGDLAAAEGNLASLQSWGPSELVTLEAARNVAVAQGDSAAELRSVKALAARRPDDLDLLERRSELEMTVGDPGAGLEIIQNLAARHPNDPELAEKLKAAKFRWRLTLLPQAVQQVAAKPELDRADVAVLLYWLVPNVRYSRPTAGKIATDVLDHPRQEEIVRVVNLGLMEVDPTLHRFSPGAPVRRGAGLRILVRLLGQAGQPVSCLGDGGAAACDVAARCHLIEGAEGCQAQSPLSGAEAVEWIRRSLDLLGAS